jgi:hypothetical protein
MAEVTVCSVIYSTVGSIPVSAGQMAELFFLLQPKISLNINPLMTTTFFHLPGPN